MHTPLACVDAVVLAGGINRIELYEGYTPGYKALVPFAGKPAISYTLRALRESGCIDRICVVGPEQELEHVVRRSIPAELVSFEPPAEDLMGSFLQGLRHFHRSETVLITTADLPLLTAQAVRDFLRGCGEKRTRRSDRFWLAVVPVECFSGPFSACDKGPSPFRDGAVCHANLAAATPAVLMNREAMDRIDRIYAARKSAVGSAMAIGWRVGLSYALGVKLLHLLTLDQMAGIASWRFNVDILPVKLEHPGAAADIDEPEDYALARHQLEGAAVE